MKAPEFDYQRPDTLADALDLLREHGAEALALAGGQSLMPLLNMRLSRPTVLVDINRIDDLKGIAEEGAHLRIGALTRYVDLERSSLVRRFAPLLTTALEHVAHVAIRNRGTIGGSLSLADPAAEMPACALALGAEIVLARASGQRTVAADDYFLGLYETARQPDELLVAVRIPKRAPDEVFLFEELARRHGDFALAGLAGRLTLSDGGVRRPRLVVFGCADRPVLATTAMEALADRPFDVAALTQAVAALDHDLQPLDTIHASAAYKRRMAKVLLRRALAGAGMDVAA